MDSFKSTICGVETVFVLRRFHSKQFLVITQYGKIANIFVVKPDVDPSSQMGLVSDSMDIQCHFGKDTDELQVALRRIIADSGMVNKRHPVIVSLALKEISKPMVDGISEILKTRLTHPELLASGTQEEDKSLSTE